MKNHSCCCRDIGVCVITQGLCKVRAGIVMPKSHNAILIIGKSANKPKRLFPYKIIEFLFNLNVFCQYPQFRYHKQSSVECTFCGAAIHLIDMQIVFVEFLTDQHRIFDSSIVKWTFTVWKVELPRRFGMTNHHPCFHGERRVIVQADDSLLYAKRS